MKSISEFAKNGGIILTDAVSDMSRILRSLNRYQSQDLAGVRVMGIRQAAEELFCAVKAAKGEELYAASQSLCTAMMYEILSSKERPVFLQEPSLGMDTAAEFVRVMNILRENHVREEYTSSNDEKIAALRKLTSDYETGLRKAGFADYAMILDEVIAALRSSETENDPAFLLPWIAEEIGTPEDIRLKEKEKELLELLQKSTGKEMITLSVPKAGKQQDISFFRAYGGGNEAAYAVKRILENKIPFGDVAVVYAGDEHENDLRSELENRNIPYRFLREMHAAANDRVGFMLDALEFAGADYSYESLRRLVHNRAFHLPGSAKSYTAILRKGIGWGLGRYVSFFPYYEKEAAEWEQRQHKDWEEEQKKNERAFVQFMKELIDALSQKDCHGILKGLLNVVDDYTAKNENFQKNIREKIKELIRAFACVRIEGDPMLILTDSLKKLTVSCSEDAGAVALVPYGSRMLLDRRYLFAVGLSRENTEKTRTESPVLSDAELGRFAEGDYVDAAGKNRRLREEFERLIGFSFETMELGYSGYDTVNMLECAPARIWRELLKAAGRKEEEVLRIGYDLAKGDYSLPAAGFYEAWKSSEEEAEEAGAETEEDAADAEAAEAEAEENEISEQEPKSAEESGLEKGPERVRRSASGIHTLLGCPLKYHYQYHERIAREEQLKRSGYVWLAGNESGTLFHNTMEEYAKLALIADEKETPDKKLLEECFERQAEKMHRQKPAPSAKIMEREKADILAALQGYVEWLHKELNETGRKVLACEAPFDDLIYDVYRTKEAKETTEDAAAVSEAEKENGPEAAGDFWFGLCLDGQIDRIDGCMEEDTLLLDVIDYKTGNKDNLSKGIKDNTQIQHFVYAAAAKKWAEENKQEIQARFGKKFKTVCINDVRYDLPFEKEDGEIQIISATKVLDGFIKDYARSKGKWCKEDAGLKEKMCNGEMVFPAFVKRALCEVEGNYADQKDGGGYKLEGIPRPSTKMQCNYCVYADICRYKMSELKN